MSGSDGNDYPTSAQIKRVRKWDFHDPVGWFAYLLSIWHWPDYGPRQTDTKLQEANTVEFACSTGGWSGNEEIIAAMRKNSLLWMITWYQSRRGGHYLFRVYQQPKQEAP